MVSMQQTAGRPVVVLVRQDVYIGWISPLEEERIALNAWIQDSLLS